MPVKNPWYTQATFNRFRFTFMEYYELDYAERVRAHTSASKLISLESPTQRKGILEMLQEHFPGYHPLVSLAQLAQDSAVSIDQVIQIHTTLAKYVAPQLKQVDIHAHIESEIVYKPVIHRFDGSLDSDDIEDAELVEDEGAVFL
jgi:hypothetical protein